jgi:hypothetical protein
MCSVSSLFFFVSSRLEFESNAARLSLFTRSNSHDLSPSPSSLLLSLLFEPRSSGSRLLRFLCFRPEKACSRSIRTANCNVNTRIPSLSINREHHRPQPSSIPFTFRRRHDDARQSSTGRYEFEQNHRFSIVPSQSN